MDIFSKVAKHVPSKLLFVGEGPELSKVIHQVKELGLMEQVMFCGKQDDVAQIISLADVMLLPSEKESFGLVASRPWPAVCLPSDQTPEGFPS